MGLLRSEKAFVDRQKQNVFAGLELFQNVLTPEIESEIVSDVVDMMAAGKKGLFLETEKIKDTYLQPAATRSGYGRYVSFGPNITFHHRHSPATASPRLTPRRRTVTINTTGYHSLPTTPS